jgi:16S rRNA G966 N2-methylase RsmD
MKIEQVKINDVFPYLRNAKKHDKTQIANVAESIKQFGMVQPIVVDKDNNVIIGHCRLLACKQLKMKEVPIVKLEDLTPEEANKLRLLDNKLNESEWNFELLAEDVPSLDFDGFDIDWEIPEVETTDEKEIIEDEIPEEAETRCKLGDLWQLGNHKLICGDSTDVAVIDRLMDGVKAKLLLTDPPYGVKAVESGGHNDGKKAGKQMCRDNVYMPVIGDDTTDTARANYDVALTCTENQIIFGGNYFTDFLPPSRCWIVWDKKVAGSFADGELAWTSFDRNLKIYEFMWSGMRRQGDRTVEGKTRVHPTQKPVGMLADILRDFSEENDIILDCFGGSGSTLIACEQLNRKCYMCELDPHYCSVILQRWENLTGQKAVRIDAEETE